MPKSISSDVFIIRKLQIPSFLTFLFAFFFLNSFWLYGNNSSLQTRKITGHVTSVNGESLPGVNIVEKGTTNGAVTDMDGKFTISLLSPQNAMLVVSFVGYLNEEISIIEGTDFYEVSLVENIQELDEIVVVGYGYQKKSDLTGSVASIDESQLQSVSVTNAAEAMKGRIAGVSISQNDAAPGSNLTIKIRGNNSINSSNSPLIVIDGFTQAGDLSSLNPRDIKSVEVLKDASACAIYGARGANGVILVTTYAGDKSLKVNFNASFGIKTIRNKLDLLNAPEYMRLANEARGAEYYSEDEIANAKTTDWQDLVYRNGALKNYQLSIKDGNEKTKYILSANYTDDQGIVLNSYFKRFSVKARTISQISEKITFDNTIYAARTTNNSTPRNTFGYGFNPSVSDLAIKFTPDMSVKDEFGNYNNLNDQPNPYGVAKERIDILTRKFIYDFAQLEYNPWEFLNLKSTFGANLTEDLSQQYWPSTIGPVAGGDIKGLAGSGNGSNFSWSNENILTFKKSIKDHNLHLTAAFTQEHEQSYYEGMQAQGFLSDLLTYYGISGAQNTDKTVLHSSGQVENYMSYLGRLFYNYRNTYYLTVSVRRDGSSKFAKNEKWGTFPSMAVAYRISEEAFMKNQSIINNLKIRGSYGITGNTSGLGNYRDRYLFDVSNRMAAIFNEDPQKVLRLTNLENPDLKWENTAQTDIGFDLGLFSDKITLVADYFYKKTSNLLFYAPLPPGIEVSNQWKNIGSLENKGFEFSLNTVNIKKSKFNWTSTANFSLVRNKVLDLGESDFLFSGYMSGVVSGNTPLSIVQVGQPLGSFFGYNSLGVFPDNSSVTQERINYSYLPNPNSPQGYMKFKDINGDGKVNNNDVTIIGCAQPDFTFGLTNQIEFMDFDFNLFLEGVVGADVYNVNRFILDNTNANTNASTRVLNRWTPENRNTDIPKAGATITEGHSGYIEDGTYYRIRDIQLGYTLPRNILNKINIDNLRVYVSAQNYFTWTKYTGYDPEVNSRGSQSILQNIDYGSYPTFKSLTFGINVDF